MARPVLVRTEKKIPDEILNNLLCDACHKFLSVKPVKISLGRMICGRCMQTGVLSGYRLLDKHFLFKCINRFTGCRKLLNSKNRWNHEKQCKSRSDSCSICFKDVYMHLMLQHFEDYHKSSILTQDSFIIDLNTTVAHVQHAFLYRYLDYLIGINLRINNSSVTFVEFFPTLMGSKPVNEVLEIKFFIYMHESRNGESEFKSINTRYLESSNTIHRFDIDEFQNYGQQLFITFDLKFYKIFLVPLVPNINVGKDRSSSTEKLLSSNFKTETLVRAETGKFLPDAHYFQPIRWRSVILNEQFYKLHPEFSVKHGVIFNELEQTSINLLCFNCKILSWPAEQYVLSSYVLLKDTEYYNLCVYCELYFESQNKTIEKLDVDNVLPYDLYRKVKFLCRWDCYKFFDFIDIYQHELNCTNQPLMDCCCKREILLADFYLHFNQFHLPEHEDCEVIYLLNADTILYSRQKKVAYFIQLVINKLVVIKLVKSGNVIDISTKCYFEEQKMYPKQTLMILIYSSEGGNCLFELEKKGRLKGLDEFMIKCYFKFYN